MINFNGVKISYFIPGRVRIKIKQLKRNEDFAEQIRNNVRGMEFLEELEVNTLTGSVLVRYDPDQKEELKKIIEQAHQLNVLPEDIDLESIHAILEGRENPGSYAGNAGSLSEEVRSFFSQMNDQVKSWTGDTTSLNELVPLGLFGLALRNLLVSETIMGPPWHACFWYAFSTFLILNPSDQDRDNRKEEQAVPK